ncbi:hypothetical protein [Streptomyces cadmiisoli]|uniref:hypothetical protein n=1 Tax=Streptomyces cadmiisoli TaxID=2184053 RepID=UPI0036509C49
MNIARCLDTIDQLCLRPFPAEHGWSDAGREGPGFHMAQLAAGTSDRAHGAAQAADLDACKEGIAQRLHARWGATHPWGMLTLRTRGERGEEIPEPWASLSVLADEVYVWRAAESGRWVAVGVTDREETGAARLLAVVTDTDPP